MYCVYQLEPGRALQAFMVLPYRLHYKTFCNLQAPLEPSIATHEKKSEIKFEILFEKWNISISVGQKGDTDPIPTQICRSR